MFSQTCPDREEGTTACYVITFLRFWANEGKFKAGASYARGEESKFPSFGFFRFCAPPLARTRTSHSSRAGFR